MKLLCFLFIITACNAETSPVHWPSFVYLCEHWLDVDHLGNQVGYDFGMYATLCQEDGEFKMQIGRDAGHWGRNGKRQIVWMPDPNKVLVELAELKMQWDNEKWLHYVSGELYIEPGMADANQIAEEWMQK